MSSKSNTNLIVTKPFDEYCWDIIGDNVGEIEGEIVEEEFIVLLVEKKPRANLTDFQKRSSNL